MDAQSAACWPDPAPEGAIRPSEQVIKYKKRLLNDGDFMNECKLHLTINIFATSYNPKQL